MARTFQLAGSSGTAQVELDDENSQFGFFGSGSSGLWRQVKPFNRAMLPGPCGIWQTGVKAIGKIATVDTMRLLPSGSKESDEPLAGWVIDAGVGTIRHSGERIAVTQLPNETDPAKIWWGILVKASVSMGGVGAEGQLGAAFQMASGKAFVFFQKVGKVLYGYGASGGVALILFTGYPNPNGIRGATSSGADFALTVGERWGSWVKSLREVGLLTKLPWGAVPKLPKAVKTLDEMAAAAKALQATEEWANYAKIVVAGLGVDTRQQNYTTFDIPPAGGGCEVSIQYTWGSITTIRELN